MIKLRSETYHPVATTIMGTLFVVFFLIVFFYQKGVSDEYPLLKKESELNDVVFKEHTSASGGAFVYFESGKKFLLLRSKNFVYEDFPSLADVLVPGDKIVKKKLSDTIRVSHRGKEYFYILGQTIGKEN